jgi:hypothetical protein
MLFSGHHPLTYVHQQHLHDATRVLIGAKSRTMDNIQHQIDDVSGFAKKMYPEEFWQ